MQRFMSAKKFQTISNSPTPQNNRSSSSPTTLQSTKLLGVSCKRLSGPDAMPGRRPCPPGPGKLTLNVECDRRREQVRRLLSLGAAGQPLRHISGPGVSFERPKLWITNHQGDAMVFPVRGAREAKRILLANFLGNLDARLGNIGHVLGKECTSAGLFRQFFQNGRIAIAVALVEQADGVDHDSR